MTDCRLQVLATQAVEAAAPLQRVRYSTFFSTSVCRFSNIQHRYRLPHAAKVRPRLASPNMTTASCTKRTERGSMATTVADHPAAEQTMLFCTLHSALQGHAFVYMLAVGCLPVCTNSAQHTALPLTAARFVLDLVLSGEPRPGSFDHGDWQSMIIRRKLATCSRQSVVVQHQLGKLSRLVIARCVGLE